ncbi:MAG TPA: hypothetical protein P5349_07320 [Tenuifilaceae bacterium]|nr:hypothetical protein [Tenuifilaceae bacterium]
MDNTQLIDRLRYSLKKNDVLQLASFFASSSQSIDQLVMLATDNNPMLAFHSAWVLENCLLSNSDLLNRYSPKLLEVFPCIVNNSVKRHISKLLSLWIFGFDDLSERVAEGREAFQQLAETCFDWVLSPSTPVAVKANCLKILARVSPYFQWVKDELPNVVRLVGIDASPGIKSISKKVLKEAMNHEKG